MRTLTALAVALGLAACAEPPRLDLPSGPAVGPAELQPVGPLLARADALAISANSAPALAGSLQSRAAALQARATGLRGPVIPPATRARMQDGPRQGALP